MVTRDWGIAMSVALLLAGCASSPPAKPAVQMELGQSIEQNRSDADVQHVVRGVQMILHGHIQAAIDGPFDDVVAHYEAQYGKRQETYYSARGMTDALLYAALPPNAKPASPVVVLGPAWAMAYWGRGYAYNEMARYDDALIELRKALALAPLDAQYNIEIGYTYQRQGQWSLSLAHYKTAEAYVSITVASGEVDEISCKAFRGQGYDLVELHRYDAARAAYRSCLKLKPGEPKSMGELNYIDTAEARGRQH